MALPSTHAKRNYAFRYHRQHIEVVDEGYVEIDNALKSNHAVVTAQKVEKKPKPARCSTHQTPRRTFRCHQPAL